MSKTTIPNTTKWLPDDKVADRYDVTTRTIQRWEKDPELGFPQAVWFGRRRKRRSLEALQAYDRKCAARQGR